MFIAPTLHRALLRSEERTDADLGYDEMSAPPNEAGAGEGSGL